MDFTINRPLCFTDIHFGKYSDSERHNQDCMDFIDWAITQFHEHKCDSIIFLGDWHDNQVHTRWDTVWFSHQAKLKLSALGVPVYFIIGNHDLWFKKNRSVHTHPGLEFYPNFHVINELTQIGDVLLCPYLFGTEFNAVAASKAKYIFGHFELAGFMVNENYEMDEHHGLNPELFYPEYLFSGHFHKRQQKTNSNGTTIVYIGNAFPHTFNDAGDRERGAMVLDRDNGPIFLNWTQCPTYDYIDLSEVLGLIEADTLDQRFDTKATIKIINDIKLFDPDLSELRDFLRTKGYRRLELPEPDDENVIEQTPENAVSLSPDGNITDFFFNSLNQVDTEGSKYEVPRLQSLFNRAKEKHDRGEAV